MIPEKDWIWLGTAQHFVGRIDCRFHMATVIGDRLVSTIGEYVVRHRGMVPLGSTPDSFYETIVFKVDGILSCGCCANVTDWCGESRIHSKTGDAAMLEHKVACTRAARGDRS